MILGDITVKGQNREKMKIDQAKQNVVCGADDLNDTVTYVQERIFSFELYPSSY